jgi:hypothetical protein
MWNNYAIKVTLLLMQGKIRRLAKEMKGVNSTFINECKAFN